jgi:excisionase family DNA binding protein
MGALGDWLTVEEAADLTGYNPEQIRRLARESKVNSRKWGKSWMINRISLLDYIKNEGRGPRTRKGSQ